MQQQLMINIAFLLSVDDVTGSLKRHGYSFSKISKPISLLKSHFPIKEDIILHYVILTPPPPNLAFIVLIDVVVNNFNSSCEAPIAGCWYINR